MPFISAVHNPRHSLDSFLSSLAATGAKNTAGQFVLALGSTHTSDIEEISAAGATPEMRRQTPAIDAEALVLGRTVLAGNIPTSPAGIVSPVVITRAAVGLLRATAGASFPSQSSSINTTVVNCGSFFRPAVPHITAGLTPAGCVSSGAALNIKQVEHLFREGLKFGKQAIEKSSYLILAECVPGGTTTALGVLLALGHKAQGLLSSSLPQADHDLKSRLVEQGLQKANLPTNAVAAMPLLAVAALGDPMQAFVAGAALSASQSIPVMLAGGSQMLAVWALMQALCRTEQIRLHKGSLGVITTKWVAFDPSAGAKQLAILLDAPFAASCPDFSSSRHRGIAAYEQGHVKEGAGAGGAMAAAHLIAGRSSIEIVEAIDRCYDEVVLGTYSGSPVAPSFGTAVFPQ